MSNHHGMEDLKGISAFCYRHHEGQANNRFGRLFANLSPLYLDPNDLIKLGKQGGPMDHDAGTNVTQSVTVGDVFFGQFIDHDITLDLTSSLSATADVAAVSNARTPTLDLDCIYGMGPEAHGYLYYDCPGEPFHKAKLLTGKDGTAAKQATDLAAKDLCRTVHGTAIIGDFRNDENRLISQMQLAMICFHNRVAEELNAAEGLEGKELYEKTRQLVTWHYQWVVITDFLVKMCGRPVVADILANGRKFYCVDPHQEPYIPIEFSVAAYRFGHSMIPQQVKIKPNGNDLDLFGKELGRGFRPLDSDEAVVDWSVLVEVDSGTVPQMANKLDSQMATILLNLPFITEPDEEKSLASRNLLRGQSFLLPSGEAVAQEMAKKLPIALESQSKTVTNAALNSVQDIDNSPNLNNGTPLWYYILLEAETIGRESETGSEDSEPGEGLGPIGARIVAETILGLIELDERSFLAVNRNWRPVEDGVGVSTLGEMLTYSLP